MEVVPLAYPDYRRVPYGDIHLSHLIGFVMAQMPDYNQDEIGYGGDSDGAGVMAGLMTAHLLTVRSFVGVIHATGSLEGFGIRHGSFGFTRRLGAGILSPESIFTFLYRRLPFIPPLIRMILRQDFPVFHRSILVKSLFKGLRSLKYPNNTEVFIFSTQCPSFEDRKEVRGNPGTSMTLVPLHGRQGDAFNAVNRRRVIDFIQGRV
jgi:hypothetical protein